MSSLQTLKQFVNDRLVAAAEEIFGVFQQTVSELENELNRQREQLDVFLKQPVVRTLGNQQQQQVIKKENSYDCRPSLDFEDPEPPHNEDQNQENVALVQVKSEDVSQTEEEPSTSRLTRHIKTEADEYYIGGSELYALHHSGHQRPLSSECDTDDSEEWRRKLYLQSDSESVEVPKGYVGQKKDCAKSLKCSGCGKAFSAKAGLTRHFCKSLTCLLCRKCFNTRHDLENHMRSHTGEKPFNCSTFLKRFKSKGNLKAHLRVHTGEKPFSCSICHKKFTYDSNLHKHMRIHKR